MTNLQVSQETILDLFSNKKTRFLIPDYQRPYAWGENECQTLWDDLFLFSFPNNDCDEFDENNEYYLGSIVTFKNDDGKMEVIDGQQRLTTLLLLLRAFYDKYKDRKDNRAVQNKEEIQKCIWEKDAFKGDIKVLKIESEVATDYDKEIFLKILQDGEVSDDNRSIYAKNYLFFKKKIDEFVNELGDYLQFLPNRIMNKCILLLIEADSQDTALRIFSTLNDRGKPLSDADIFKAQFYKHYSSKGEKEEFIERWKNLEVKCNNLFPSAANSSLDEIFTRYMYYERAKKGEKSSTTKALRKFYEEDNYALLRDDKTFDNLIDLADFWSDVKYQIKNRFSDDVLKRLFVLNYAPNGMWTYFLSVYYMVNRHKKNHFKGEEFCQFLDKIIAFIWAYAITNPGVNALRTPIYAEMINVVNNKPVTFNEFLFDVEQVKNAFNNYKFTNSRRLTRSMLTWWAFHNPNQELLELDSKYDIEHIYAKDLQEKEGILIDSELIESLGNKSLLESKLNRIASNHHFEFKRKIYKGEFDNECTKIKDLWIIAEKSDFKGFDIEQRNNEIIVRFREFMDDCHLLKKK